MTIFPLIIWLGAAYKWLCWLIAARKADIHLIFDRACAIDLATKGTGKTVLEAVKTSVNPKVIDCSEAKTGRVNIDGVGKDGIMIKAKVSAHLRRWRWK